MAKANVSSSSSSSDGVMVATTNKDEARIKSGEDASNSSVSSSRRAAQPGVGQQEGKNHLERAGECLVSGRATAIGHKLRMNRLSRRKDLDRVDLKSNIAQKMMMTVRVARQQQEGEEGT